MSNAFSARSKRTPTKTAKHETLTLDFGDLGLPDLGGLARTARIEIGDPERRSYGTIIPVSWSDAHGGAFPRFTGIIEVSPLSRHEVQLAILGRYSAPLGPLGAMFDAAVGRTIAERTIQHFVDDLARELEAA